MQADEVLGNVARQVRRARRGRQWTIRELAERSGVSARFLIQLESGHANISVKRLAELADAFRVSTAELLYPDLEHERRTIASSLTPLKRTIRHPDWSIS